MVGEGPTAADAYRAQLPADWDVTTADGRREAPNQIDAALEEALLDRPTPGISGNTVSGTLRNRGLGCPGGRVGPIVTAVDPDVDSTDIRCDESLTTTDSHAEGKDTIERL